jgi:hypothetical protein
MVDHLSSLDTSFKIELIFLNNSKNKEMKTYGTIEAFHMICATHGFEIFVTWFDRKFATGTFSLKHSTIIYFKKFLFLFSSPKD